MSDDMFEDAEIINSNEALIINAATGRVAQAKNNANMIVVFHEKKTPNLSKSTEEGIAYDKKIYTRIQRAGDKYSIVDRPLRENDKRRFPKQWRAFCEGKDQNAGTSTAEMVAAGIMSAAQANLLASLGIKTIEQLTTISVSMMESIGPDAGQLMRLGKGYLAEKAPKVQADAVSELKAQLDELKAAMGVTPSVEKKAAAPKKKAAVKKVAKTHNHRTAPLDAEGFNLPEEQDLVLPQL